MLEEISDNHQILICTYVNILNLSYGRVFDPPWKIFERSIWVQYFEDNYATQGNN